MYLNDGTPHHDGIANEHYTIYMINHNPKLAPIREKLGYLIHKGGTHQNPDAMCLDTGVKVSLKTKSLKVGRLTGKICLSLMMGSVLFTEKSHSTTNDIQRMKWVSETCTKDCST